MATYHKRKRAHFPAALLATSVVFTSLAIAPVYADQNPSRTASLSPQEQYRLELEIYFNKLKAREVEMRILNQNFKIAIEKARREYVTALRSAKGPTDKSLLSAKFDEVKSSAAAMLEKAREDLGPMPVPPQEPVKGLKSKMNRETQRNKSR
jgi:hypothetical protein